MQFGLHVSWNWTFVKLDQPLKLLHISPRYFQVQCSPRQKVWQKTSSRECANGQLGSPSSCKTSQYVMQEYR